MALFLPSAVSTSAPLLIHQYQSRHTLLLSPLPNRPMPYLPSRVSFFAYSRSSSQVFGGLVGSSPASWNALAL